MKVTIYNEDLIPIGTKVYVPQPMINGVREEVIVGYQARIGKDDDRGEVVAYVTDYILGRMTSNQVWKADEFRLTYDEAIALANIYTLNFTDDDWFDAIGVTRDEQYRNPDAIERCELKTCCGLQSSIRDLLEKMMDKNCADGVMRAQLIKMLLVHDPPDKFPILTRVLKAMGIVWRKTKLLVDGKTIKLDYERQTH